MKRSFVRQSGMKLPDLTIGVSSPRCFVGSEIPPKQKIIRIHPRVYTHGFLRRRINLIYGQSLVEVMIALSVAAIILTALVTLSTKSVTNSDVASVSQSATLYAEEAANWLRQQRDADWGNFALFADGVTEYCLQTTASGLQKSACNFIPGTVLSRTVILTPDDPSDIKNITVVIKVYWNDRTGYHEERVVTNLTNWKGTEFVPTP